MRPSSPEFLELKLGKSQFQNLGQSSYFSLSISTEVDLRFVSLRLWLRRRHYRVDSRRCNSREPASSSLCSNTKNPNPQGLSMRRGRRRCCCSFFGPGSRLLLSCHRGFGLDGGWNGSEGSKVGLLLCAPLAYERGEVVGEPCCCTVPAAAGLLQCIRRTSMLQSQQRRVV